MKKTNLKTIQVVLNLTPKHLEMIRRFAKLRETSVGKWIMQATEGSLRSDAYDFDDIDIEVGFGDDEITEVMEEVRA